MQCDARGQIVIPKDVRTELGIDEGTGFWMFTITDEGILLKTIEKQELSDDSSVIKTLTEKSEKIPIQKKNITKTIKKYKKTKEGNLELL